jgi:hypothetical protein
MQPAIFVDANNQQRTVHYPLSACTGNKKALLIGINYTGTKSALRGCHNDAHSIRNFLCSRGFPNSASNIVMLLDDPKFCPGPAFWPTRANIVTAMQWLVSGTRPGDSLFLHFSGHGGQMPDQDGDEENGFDETILPVDFETAGVIVDDEMHAILVRQLPPGVRLTVIFDSCHSGTALDLSYVYDDQGRLVVCKNPSLKSNAQSLITDVGKALLTRNPMSLLKTFQKFSGPNGISGIAGIGKKRPSPEEVRQKRETWSDVIMLSGCADNQTSADAMMHSGAAGAMSHAFVEAMNQAPNQSYSQAIGRIRDILRSKRYTQIAQLSSGHPMDMGMPFLI